MTRRPFSTSPGYLQSIRGLHSLHALTVAGSDDSPEADAVRDGLDQYWYDLSKTEQDRITGLSADLFSISEPVKEPLPSNPQVQRKLDEAREATKSGNWDQALTLLRRWGQHVDPAKLSFLRGTVWHEAGDDRTANLFFEHASLLDPVTFQEFYLANLWQTDPERAREIAGDVLKSDRDFSPEVVVTAAHIQLFGIQGSIVVESHSIIEDLMSILKRVLVRVETEDHAKLYPNAGELLRLHAISILAECYDRLGDRRTAIRYLNDSPSIRPDDDAILVKRGILRYGVESGAVDDLQRAAELGSHHPWPYFYLAHHALVEGRYQDCLAMCERGLALTVPDEVRANLHEWLAISRAELNYPADRVRSAFEEAVRLAPDADHIRDNLASFEKALADPTGPKPDWIKLKASTVQAFGRSEYLPPLRPMPVAA